MNVSEDVTIKTHIKQKEEKSLCILTVTKTLILRKEMMTQLADLNSKQMEIITAYRVFRIIAFTAKVIVDTW